MARVKIARRRKPRRRERRDDERRAGVVALERRDERPQYGYLAGRRAVQPDARRQWIAQTHSKTQREVASPSRAESVHEPGREDDAGDEVDEIEQKSHRQLDGQACRGPKFTL